MYICEDCRAEFEEPLIEKEIIGEYWGVPTEIKYQVCPKCKSTEIEEEKQWII